MRPPLAGSGGIGRTLRETPMPDAIIFVPPGPAGHGWLRICAEYCAHHGYEVVAVASDWADVVRMLQDGVAEVVVVGSRDHLPADRPWRIEAVAEQTHGDPPEHRRPNRRRR